MGGSIAKEHTSPDRSARWIAVVVWTPALLWALALTSLLSLMPLPSALKPARLEAARPDALRAKTVFALNLLLLPGNALALTWYIALHALARSRTAERIPGEAEHLASRAVRDGYLARREPRPIEIGGPEGIGEHARARSFQERVAQAGGITVGVGSLVTLVLATWVGGEQTLVMALCIYAPTLAVTYGMLVLASARIASWWRVLLAGVVLGTIMLATQLLYLEPDGKPPSEAVFALASLPIEVAVGVWLVAWSIVPRVTQVGAAP